MAHDEGYKWKIFIIRKAFKQLWVIRSIKHLDFELLAIPGAGPLQKQLWEDEVLRSWVSAGCLQAGAGVSDGRAVLWTCYILPC